MTKTKIYTKDMAWTERDIEVTLVFLKILVIYAQDNRKLATAKWDAFFVEVFPDEAKLDDESGKWAVWALTDAKKYLIEKKNVVIRHDVKGKRYKLYTLNPERIDDVIAMFDRFPRDYDESLLLDIAEFKAKDVAGKIGKYATTTEALDSMGL